MPLHKGAWCDVKVAKNLISVPPTYEAYVIRVDVTQEEHHHSSSLQARSTAVNLSTLTFKYVTRKQGGSSIRIKLYTS